MAEISFRTVHNDDIEPCRELCNELMAYQRSKAFKEKERFDAMDFDTRMKKSYEGALEKQVVIVYDCDAPVGYVFSTIEPIEAMKNSPFRLLPTRDDLPSKIGCLSNLYLKEGYRGIGLGRTLFERSMEWFDGYDDVPLIYIFISNGNDDAYRFYTYLGFEHSHDVMGGFIIAVSKWKK